MFGSSVLYRFLNCNYRKQATSLYILHFFLGEAMSFICKTVKGHCLFTLMTLCQIKSLRIDALPFLASHALTIAYLDASEVLI